MSVPVGTSAPPPGTVNRAAYEKVLQALRGINTYIGQVTGAITSVPVQAPGTQAPAPAMQAPAAAMPVPMETDV
jgi:hypothetical protein